MAGRLWNVAVALLTGGAMVSACAPTGGGSLAGPGGGRSPAPPAARAGGIEWIDVHAHLVGGRGDQEDYRGAVSAAVAVMDEAGIRTMIVMPPPQVRGMPGLHDSDRFVASLAQHPRRFAFLGGGGTLNVMLQEAGRERTIDDRLRRRFEEQALDILRQGAAGFGEITAHHLSHVPDHPYEWVPADHPLLLLLADIAARHNVVIDLHFDVVAADMRAPEWLASPPNPPHLPANLAAFERLLAHNRKAKIVWAHAGSDHLGHWTTGVSRRLLAQHPSLSMSLRMGPGRAPENHPLTPTGEIKPEWLSLLRDFPDRFVIGGDQFIVSPSVRGGGPGVIFSQRAPRMRERTRAFLRALPPDLARRIADENARRLYRLQD